MPGNGAKRTRTYYSLSSTVHFKGLIVQNGHDVKVIDFVDLEPASWLKYGHLDGVRQGGETGRRAGLKIRRSHQKPQQNRWLLGQNVLKRTSRCLHRLS